MYFPLVSVRVLAETKERRPGVTLATTSPAVFVLVATVAVPMLFLRSATGSLAVAFALGPLNQNGAAPWPDVPRTVGPRTDARTWLDSPTSCPTVRLLTMTVRVPQTKRVVPQPHGANLVPSGTPKLNWTAAVTPAPGRRTNTTV